MGSSVRTSPDMIRWIQFADTDGLITDRGRSDTMRLCIDAGWATKRPSHGLTAWPRSHDRVHPAVARVLGLVQRMMCLSADIDPIC